MCVESLSCNSISIGLRLRSDEELLGCLTAVTARRRRASAVTPVAMTQTPSISDDRSGNAPFLRRRQRRGPMTSARRVMAEQTTAARLISSRHQQHPPKPVTATRCGATRKPTQFLCLRACFFLSFPRGNEGGLLLETNVIASEG